MQNLEDGHRKRTRKPGAVMKYKTVRFYGLSYPTKEPCTTLSTDLYYTPSPESHAIVFSVDVEVPIPETSAHTVASKTKILAESEYNLRYTDEAK